MEFDTSVRAFELKKLYNALVDELTVIYRLSEQKTMPEDTLDYLLGESSENLDYLVGEYNRKYWNGEGFEKFFDTLLDVCWGESYLKALKNKELSLDDNDASYKLFVALWEMEKVVKQR